MAQLYEALVKANDNVNPKLTPEKQITALWKRGDIVIVKPKGWRWGREEVKQFVIVTLPESWTEEECLCLACHMIVEGEKSNPEIPQPDISQHLLCRSRYSIDLEEWLDRCCEAKSDLVDDELEELKVAARSRMYDNADEYQPIKDDIIPLDCIEDKNDLPEIRDMSSTLSMRLKTELHKNVKERAGVVVPAGVTVKALKLSQTESRPLKLQARIASPG